jgi:hypothetical protein
MKFATVLFGLPQIILQLLFEFMLKGLEIRKSANSNSACD